MAIDWAQAGFTPEALLAVIWGAMAPLVPMAAMLMGVSLGLWLISLVLRSLVRGVGNLTHGQRQDRSLPHSLRSGGLHTNLFGGVASDASAWAGRERQRKLISPYLASLRAGGEHQVREHSPMSWASVFRRDRAGALRAASALERSNAARQSAVQNRLAEMTGGPVGGGSLGLNLDALLSTLPGGHSGVSGPQGAYSSEARLLRRVKERVAARKRKGA